MNSVPPDGSVNPGDAVSQTAFIIYNAFAFFLIPLSFYTGAVEPVLTLRFILLGLLVLLLSLTLLFQSFRGRNIGTQKSPRVFTLLMVGYLLANNLSLFAVVNLSEGIFEITKVFLFISFIRLSIFIVGESPSRKIAIAKAITLASLVISVLEIMDYWNIVRLIDAGWVGPGATMVNRNLLSSYLFLCSGFVLFLSIDRRGTWRTVSLAALALITYCLLVTGTRAVWLAVIIALTAVPAVLFFSGSGNAIKKTILREKKVFALFVSIPLASILAFSMIKPSCADVPKLLDRIASITDNSVNSNWERIHLWRKTIRMSGEHLLLGVGAGNWKIALPSYGTGDLVSPYMKEIEVRPYNDFLWVLSETGIPGLMFYGGMILLCGWYALVAVRQERTRSGRLLYSMMLMTIIGFSIISFFDFPKERIEHLVLFGTVLALCAIAARSQAPRPIRQNFGLWYRTLLAIMTAGSMISIMIGCARFKGDIHSLRMLAAYEADDRTMMIRESNRAFSFFYTMEPSSTPLHWYKGVAEFKLGDTSSALQSYLTAQRYHPFHIHVLSDIGTCYSLTGNHSQAEKYYSAALDISPCFEPCLINLAAELYNTGRHQEAWQTIQRCKFPHSDNRYDRFFKIISEQNTRGVVK